MTFAQTRDSTASTPTAHSGDDAGTVTLRIVTRTTPRRGTPRRRLSAAARLLAIVQRARQLLRDLADDLNALQDRRDLLPGRTPMELDSAEALDAAGALRPLEERLRSIVDDEKHRDTSAARIARWGFEVGVGSNDRVGTGGSAAEMKGVHHV